MPQKIQQFIILSEKILSETGELRTRRSWNELASVSSQLAPHMVQLSQGFKPKNALLFLLSCGNEGQQKNSLISKVFRKIFSKLPNNETLNILGSISKIDLNGNVLSFLYENGPICSVAAYTAAKLGLKVKSDAFEFFLSAHEWTQDDLINLSFLVYENEKEDLKNKVYNSYKSNPTEANRLFLNILNNASVLQPVVPNGMTIENDETISNKNKTVKHPINSKSQVELSNNNYKYKLTGSSSSGSLFPNNNQPNNKINVPNNTVVPNQNIVSNQNFVPKQQNQQFVQPQKLKQNQQIPQQIVNQPNKEVSTVKTNDNQNQKQSEQQEKGKIINDIKEKISNLDQVSLNLNLSSIDIDKYSSFFKKKPVVISIVATVVFIAVLIVINTTTNDGDNLENISVVKPPKEVKLPDYWVNAVTNKKLTPQYIQADVDYRMGELYLSRNKYNEAVQFFQMALKTEPNHNICKLRWGYTEYLLGHYSVAEKLLLEVVKSDSMLQCANLYLARNYSKENKLDEAEKHFKKEYANYGVLEVGMEYANFLYKIGKQDEAMDFLASLQEKFPDKMLVLDSKTEKFAKKTKTKG